MKKNKNRKKNNYSSYYNKNELEHFYSDNGRGDIAGWIMLIIAGIFSISMIFVFKTIYEEGEGYKLVIIGTFFYSIMLLQIIGGVRLIKRSMSNTSFEKLKIKLLKVSMFVVIGVVILMYCNNAFLKREGLIDVKDLEEIELTEKYNDNYINVNDLILTCNDNDYNKIWGAKVFNKKKSFKIRYEWNILRPSKGEVIEIKVIKVQ